MPGTPTPKHSLDTMAGTDIGQTIDDTYNAAITTLDAIIATDDQGLLSARPPSTPGSPGIKGRYFYATDTGQLFRDFGTGWDEIPLNPLGAADIQNGAVTPAKLATAPYARVSRSSVFAVPNNAFTDVRWNRQDFDTEDPTANGIADVAGGAGVDHLLTVRTAGLYAVTACLVYAANTTGRRHLELKHKRGATVTTIARDNRQAMTSGPGDTGLSTSETYPCLVGDQFFVTAYQDSGGSVNIQAGSDSHLDVARVGS